MQLSRETPNAFDPNGCGDHECHRSSDEHEVAWPRDQAPYVYTWFNRFGNGPLRTSDFVVRTKWEDVRKMIEKFSDAGHPEAVALQQAVQLAAAAKELGWQAPDSLPQSN
jgi:hypothetical protein